MMEKGKKIKLYEVANFIEELSWLLEKKKNISLKEVSLYIRDLNTYKDPYIALSRGNNSHSQFLVGILPSLFLDEELFKNRGEILDFAETVLNLPVSRAGKRSRTEYIGWIVCEVAKMSDDKITDLVYALEYIVGDDLKMKEMRKAKKEPNFSWTDTIIKLSKQ